MKLYFDFFDDRSFGRLVFAVTDNGVRYLSLGERSGMKKLLEHARKHGLEPVKGGMKTTTIKNQLKRYFKGQKKSFRTKLDIGYLRPFTQKALKAAFRIPQGKVATYGELARRAGSPQASRAVGQVMANNPIPLIIPCHRVIGSNGDLTGFGGGLGLKEKLLKLEGISVKGYRVSKK